MPSESFYPQPVCRCVCVLACVREGECVGCVFVNLMCCVCLCMS